MADNSTFDVQGALNAGASQDDIINYLKPKNPNVNVYELLKSGKSKLDVIKTLTTPVTTPTNLPNPKLNPNMNLSGDLLNQLKVRHVDKAGADLPNRVPNDPRLIQPQDIGTDQGVIPGVQTAAKIAATIGTPLGVIGDVAGPVAAAAAANAPKIKAALTGAGMGAGSSLLLGGSGKQTLEAALTGALGGTVGNKLLKTLFAKFGPEAGAAMSETAPGLSQPIAPGAVPGPPTSTLSPSAGVPPLQGPNPLSKIFSGGGSTGPDLAAAIPAPRPPQINLATGQMLKPGADTLTETAKAVGKMTPTQIDSKLAKLAEEKALAAKRLSVMQALKDKYGIKN